jgi:tetratricopeptide (TPR) repeat protein
VVQDLRARAWAHLGNARRIGSDLNGAEQALRRAEALLDEGSADPLEEARVLDFRVSLLSDQGWFEQAADLLDAVIAIYEDVQDQHRKGRALISQGLVLSYAGRPEQAVACLTEGLAAIDWAVEPRLALMARHNLAWSLNDCGRSEEAQRLLERFREEYHSFHDVWSELRLSWLESRIALRLGREEEAERGLGAVRARFLEKDFYDATLVMLDLAGLYLKQGKHGEVRRLAAETRPGFLTEKVHGQAAAALLAFQQAAETDSVTPALLQEIAAYLQRARRNPELRFRASG